ncbi:LysR family transcriptional regulator [Alcaligenaceae bacterium]|nr:LysR family transcriptional regulator [Alcaligenaceae bacterium]
MEIRQLEAFAAVYSAGSVTAAARLLDRSQPVVSRQIQDLEQELGFTLFTRTRPQVTLTEQGRQFYEEVHNVLAGLQQLDSRMREIAVGQPRPLRLAATASLGSTLVTEVIGQLERSIRIFEDKMNIDILPPELVAQAVADGQADIGITSLPMELGRCQLEWSGQAPCLMALPWRHPLSGQSSISLAELGDYTVITMSNKSGLRHRISTALLQNLPASNMRRHIETTSFLNALMLVRAGVGLALVDPFTATSVMPDSVVFRPIDTHVPYMMGVITHSGRVLSDGGREFIQAMWDYANQSVPGFVRGELSGLPKVMSESLGPDFPEDDSVA